MDSMIQTWKDLINTADPLHNISLQAFMYGVLCMIQESQETTKWITLEPSKIMEYSEDFTEFPIDGFELLYSHLEDLKTGPLLSETELVSVADKLINYANENIKVNILTTLINGCLLNDEQWMSIHTYIASKEIVVEDTQSPPQEKEIMSPPQGPLPQPQGSHPPKKKRFAYTRCISGRRSITPIKRRNGHKAISRHKTRTARV